MFPYQYTHLVFLDDADKSFLLFTFSFAALIPQNDEVLQKRLRNLRKLAARKKRDREANRGAGDDSDDDGFASKAHPAR